MPELPEVETVCRGLARALEGRRISRAEARRPDLRLPLPPDLAERLVGRRVGRVGRRAKYILIFLDDGGVLIAHLGMSGRLYVMREAPPPPGPHDHVILAVDDGTTVYFNDVRRFGLMALATEAELPGHAFFRELGPEPLGNDFNGPALAAALKGRMTPIKAALLDQKVVAGLGNIYVCEALFRAGLSPRRKAASVQGRRAERLAQAIRQVLREAIAAGGSSLRDYVQTNGELGYFQHHWAVYGREGAPCPTCAGNGRGGAVRRIVQSGRSTFYCASCQR